MGPAKGAPEGMDEATGRGGVSLEKREEVWAVTDRTAKAPVNMTAKTIAATGLVIVTTQRLSRISLMVSVRIAQAIFALSVTGRLLPGGRLSW